MIRSSARRRSAAHARPRRHWRGHGHAADADPKGRAEPSADVEKSPDLAPCRRWAHAIFCREFAAIPCAPSSPRPSYTLRCKHTNCVMRLKANIPAPACQLGCAATGRPRSGFGPHVTSHHADFYHETDHQSRIVTTNNQHNRIWCHQNPIYQYKQCVIRRRNHV